MNKKNILLFLIMFALATGILQIYDYFCEKKLTSAIVEHETDSSPHNSAFIDSSASDVTVSTKDSSKTISNTSNTSTTILAVGDMLLHYGIHKSAQLPDGTYDYSHVFEHTTDKIKSADIAIANQEVILGGKELGISSYPQFNSTTEFGDALVDAGFDVILHATNHALDKSEQGILNTINFWENSHPEITYLGINKSNEDQNKIKYIESNGIKIALLNYTYGTNGIAFPENKTYLVNLMNESNIASDLTEAHENADFVIVFPHWGTEYNLQPDNSQIYWAQLMADNGADLIIGTHPHVVEPVSWLTAADGRKVLCYYSTGNFISIQYYNYCMLGGMAEITLTKDNNGTYISDYNMDFVVTHYNMDRTQITTYMLNDYTDVLAAKHAILTEPYMTDYAQNYRCVNDCYPFTKNGLIELSHTIWPK